LRNAYDILVVKRAGDSVLGRNKWKVDVAIFPKAISGSKETTSGE
jgi:hypothetical protein